jgi:hypothetical protein
MAEYMGCDSFRFQGWARVASNALVFRQEALDRIRAQAATLSCGENPQGSLTALLHPDLQGIHGLFGQWRGALLVVMESFPYAELCKGGSYAKVSGRGLETTGCRG